MSPSVIMFLLMYMGSIGVTIECYGIEKCIREITRESVICRYLMTNDLIYDQMKQVVQQEEMEREGKWKEEERGDGKWKLDLNHQLQMVPSYNMYKKGGVPNTKNIDV